MKTCLFMRVEPVCLRFVGALVGSLMLSVLSNLSFAAGTNDELHSWRAQLQRQIQSSTAIVAAERQRDGASLAAEATQVARVYSPAFTAGMEREGKANNVQIGIEQSIDWQGKDDIQQRIGEVSQRQAEQRFTYQVMSTYREVFHALVAWNAAAARAALAETRQVKLNRMLALIRERQASGDLGDIDAQLTVSGVSKGLIESSDARIAMQESASRIQQLLPSLPTSAWAIPDNFWKHAVNVGTLAQRRQWIDTHRDVQLAKNQWQFALAESEMANANTSMDPSVGVVIGKSDTDNVLGLNLSIPLNLDQSRGYNAGAHRQRALSYESTYRAMYQQVRYQIDTAYQVLMERKSAQTQWQALMQNNTLQAEQLLQKKWRNGDMSTMAYLQVSRSLTDSAGVGIDIEEHHQLAMIQWLWHTAQIDTVLATHQEENN